MVDETVPGTAVVRIPSAELFDDELALLVRERASVATRRAALQRLEAERTWLEAALADGSRDQGAAGLWARLRARFTGTSDRDASELLDINRTLARLRSIERERADVCLI